VINSGMTDKIELENEQVERLKKQLENVTWPIGYGIISIQLRNGKVTFVKIEQTLKFD